MKTCACFSFLFVLLVCVVTLPAQESIDIHRASVIVPDGIIADGEWDSAAEREIRVGTTVIRVLAQHDGEALCLAFLGGLQSTFHFPEVLLDIDNAKSEGWQNDDWWFHVSGTDCHSQGEHSNYDNCRVEQGDWEGVPNADMNSQISAMEIRIPFATVGIDLSVQSRIGIAFDVTNTATSWQFWPADATLDSPASWATATIHNTATEVNENFTAASFPALLDIAPQPANVNSLLSLTLPANADCDLRLFDLAGNHIATILRRRLAAGRHWLNWPEQLARRNTAVSVYFYRLRINSDIQHGRLLWRP